ncbi:RelA/SpoT domain-containing protein [Campylobacter lari]|nr:RelA/SpoT domain-containing protein [Campylobacter lari]
MINISGNKLKTIGKKIKNNEKLTVEEQDCFSYWLNLHFEVMKKMKNHLSVKLKKLGIKNYIIAKRTKRLESISFKLQRYPNLALDRIQDIAGMRIICDSVKDVNLIRDELKKHYQKNINVFKYDNINDYINKPKDDGYRSCHLMFTDIKTKCKVEIQIRTKLQHSWATAVEIIDMGSNSKIKQGNGEIIYKDFFKLSSVLFSYLEKTNAMEQYKSYDLKKTYYFLKKLYTKHNILDYLSALVISNEHIIRNIGKNSNYKDNFYFVISLNYSEKNIHIDSFSKDSLDSARKHYNDLEKNNNIDVVLISLDNQKKIKQAYPNYYLDSSVFIENIIKNEDAIKYSFYEKLCYYVSYIYKYN